jgi:hypothetical protein
MNGFKKLWKKTSWWHSYLQLLVPDNSESGLQQTLQEIVERHHPSNLTIKHLELRQYMHVGDCLAALREKKVCNRYVVADHQAGCAL